MGKNIEFELLRLPRWDPAVSPGLLQVASKHRPFTELPYRGRVDGAFPTVRHSFLHGFRLETEGFRVCFRARRGNSSTQLDSGPGSSRLSSLFPPKTGATASKVPPLGSRFKGQQHILALLSRSIPRSSRRTFAEYFGYVNPAKAVGAASTGGRILQSSNNPRKAIVSPSSVATQSVVTAVPISFCTVKLTL